MGRGRDPNKLTAKEESLVQLVVSGMAKNEAYKKTYKSDKMSENAISVEVNKKFKLPKISLRYKELMGKHEKKALWTREMAYNKLFLAMDISEQDRNMNPFITAIKELNTLEDIYPKENEVDIDDPVYIATILKKMPKEKLEVLMNEFSKDD